MSRVSHPSPRHVVFVGAYPESLVNFRGDLIRTLVGLGYQVTAAGASASADVLARLEKLGAGYRAYPIRRNAISPFQDIETLWALRCLFREIRPDVVLAYTIKPVIWGGLAMSRRHPTNFFALITGLGFALEGTGLWRRALSMVVAQLYKAALRRARGVIFQNEDDRGVFIARGIVSRGVTHRVRGSGIDCERFCQRAMPVGPPVFLLIARLLRAKGLREFAEAARIVRRSSPDCVFRIVGGPDPSLDRIEVSEVEGWQRDGVVEYVGEVADVRPALRECHIFVLPSYHEGMPRTVLEAMAVGRPILTTDVPGCRDTVVEGQNGFLVPKGDPKALAERLEWFISHREEWARMGAASRQLAEERFDVRLVNAEMLRIMGLGLS